MEEADEEADEEAEEQRESAVACGQHAAESGRAMVDVGMVRSVEMGAERDSADELPLPPSACGTFSCHGIDNDKAKVNQDCACTAYPLKGDEQCALFIVLDGHGEKGDIVSNELLQQVATRSAAPCANAPERDGSHFTGGMCASVAPCTW